MNILLLERGDNTRICGQINEENFNIFKDIIISMFCLKKAATTQDYNV
jgi:hypothetical protein